MHLFEGCIKEYRFFFLKEKYFQRLFLNESIQIFVKEFVLKGYPNSKDHVTEPKRFV